MRAVLEDPTHLDRTAAEVMSPPLTVLGPDQTVQAAIAALGRKTPAILVCEGERAVGILTRTDVIAYVSA